MPSSVDGLANERSATVAITGIFARLSSGTNFSWGEEKVLSGGGIVPAQPLLQPLLATAPIVQGNVDLVLDELEVAVFAVLSPARDPASHAGAIVESVVEHVAAGGIAGGVDTPPGTDVDGVAIVDKQDGDVVGQPVGVEVGMLDNPPDRVLLVLEALRIVETASVVLAHPDPQCP